MSRTKIRFAVLMTCYNRSETTLLCLKHLFAAKLPRDAKFDVWLNDDGSTDGTIEKCRSFFTEQKAAGWQGNGYIINGSGNDYWCGGMRRAWDAASRHSDYDGYLWLNDDTILFDNALEQMLDHEYCNSVIIVGATMAPQESHSTTYSGRDRKGIKVEPNEEYQRVYGMNGNCAWIPKLAFARLGNFPDYFTHALGDLDYGKRAIKAGIAMYLAPAHIGLCDANKKVASWMDVKVPLIQRMKNLYSPSGGPEPNIFFRYNRLHYGLMLALRCWVTQHIRVCIPSLWRITR